MPRDACFEFSIGNRVRIIAPSLVGTVDAMIVDNQGKQYRVIYWADGTRKATWLNGWEIETTDQEF